MKFHNRYNSKPIGKGLDFTGHPEVCNQQLAEECEIRSIIDRFDNYQITDLPAVRTPVYNSEFITPTTFEDAKAMIKKVEQDFYSLPKDMQRQFGDLHTYVKDMYDISQGNQMTIAKYQHFNQGNQARIDIPDVKQSQIQDTSVSQADKPATVSD